MSGNVGVSRPRGQGRPGKGPRPGADPWSRGPAARRHGCFEKAILVEQARTIIEQGQTITELHEKVQEQELEINEIYDIDTRGQTLSCREREALRASEARPVWNRLHELLDSEAASHVLPKEKFAEALT